VDLFHHRSGDFTMSMHRSLKGTSKIAKRRNVLKRFERVDLLKIRGEWKDGDRAFGLRKTKLAE
jgi:small basic protein (TIGR04137 family)